MSVACISAIAQVFVLPVQKGDAALQGFEGQCNCGIALSHLPKKITVAGDKTEERSQDWQLGPLCQHSSPPAAQRRLHRMGASCTAMQWLPS